ncbi:MAG: T9SS type A sorting domain-containing protein [Bacteroidetes bacterium]|nr:T9SS type A sorting domain-containing protein [Bacteroidota bacterium]
MRDTLVSELIAHQSIEAKLQAADVLAENRQFSDALDVLGAYSFEGSASLKRQYLKRRALYLPFAWQGGYRDGLLALDSLEQRSVGDTALQPLFRLYPLLYSGLRLDSLTNRTPKRNATSTFWEHFLPEDIDLGQNYPNPFSDLTSFTFKLVEDRHVRLAVYDAMGREVAVVTDADYSRGVHSAVLRSSGLPSGLYFYRLTTDAGVIQRKMLLMR